MERFIKRLIRVLSPGISRVVLLSVVCGAALIYVFVNDYSAHPAAVVLYVASAYALAALCLAAPNIKIGLKDFYNENKKIARIRNTLRGHKYIGAYLKNTDVKVTVSLYMSLTLNLTYAALKLGTGIYYASFWFGAEAVFYLTLGLTRYFILRNIKKSGDLRREYKIYRFCGFLLFGLNAALAGIVFQMIHQGRGSEYPGILIFIVAAYTFAYLSASVYNLIKFRRLNSPVYTSAKTIQFVQALVAVYSLQISLFASFGDDERLAFVMNSVFGGFLCIAIFGMAVFMVVNGFKKLNGTAAPAPR